MKRSRIYDEEAHSGAGPEMGRQIAIVLYVVAMTALIIGLDVAFFRDRFWERLMLNIGIVLVFAAFYLRFVGVHGRHL
jgi:hypothetical protein